MDGRAIGVFDSGVGGLSAVKVLEHILPREDIVYFGDSGRMPYGGRTRDGRDRSAPRQSPQSTAAFYRRNIFPQNQGSLVQRELARPKAVTEGLSEVAGHPGDDLCLDLRPFPAAADGGHAPGTSPRRLAPR